MTLVCAPRTVWLLLWVHMQHETSDLHPVSPFALSLQKANVRDDMLFVIGCQRRLVRRTVCDVWIEGWFLHHTRFWNTKKLRHALVAI
jgi:hypothetical protein